MIWALRDVSFEVKRGEVLGIIGRNGAGKSTLLKILSRITEPTEGKAVLCGRVGSLLEVGTGFHPELTGRENIYLSGAILGMSKTEIDSRFDEIVAFSEIEKFLETPVKRYSSGMYVRLAFAVAAHLNPEILLVDEVLAVGDAAFQRKCLGKMRDTAKGGRTVLFVSHSMKAVSTLCSTGLFLDKGKVRLHGPVQKVVQAYLQSVSSDIPHGKNSFEISDSASFFVSSIRSEDKNGVVKGSFTRSEPVVLMIEGRVNNTANSHHIAIDLRSLEDELLFRTHSFESRDSFGNLAKKGDFTLKCTLPADLLPAATYRLGFHTAITGRKALQDVYPVLEFDIFQDELLGGMFSDTRGVLTPSCNWERV